MPLSLNKLQIYKKELDDILNEYIVTGGFISVINNYKSNKSIKNTIYEEF